MIGVWDDSQLLQQTELVHDDPTGDDSSVPVPIEDPGLNTYPPPGGRDTHELGGVGALPERPSSGRVVLPDDVLDGPLEVRECVNMAARYVRSPSRPAGCPGTVFSSTKSSWMN